jgi:hypothetical protein
MKTWDCFLLLFYKFLLRIFKYVTRIMTFFLIFLLFCQIFLPSEMPGCRRNLDSAKSQWSTYQLFVSHKGLVNDFNAQMGPKVTFLMSQILYIFRKQISCLYCYGAGFFLRSWSQKNDHIYIPTENHQI